MAGAAHGDRKRRISVPLELSEIALIEKMAADRDRSVSWFASHAIRFYLTEVAWGSQLALDFEVEKRA